MEKPNMPETVMVSVASEKAEARGGLLIAIIAAIMAISQLVGSNLEEDMMVAHNQHNSYFSWYQSKSIKQSLKESELATLESLKIGLITDKFEPKIAEVKKEIAKYKLEKNEILVGSSNIPKTEWVQDLDGKMGNIIGVKEWEKKAEILEHASGKFDLAAMFFQIALVLGAVCIIIYDNPRLQKSFIAAMLVLGIIGCGFSAWGYMLSKV
jgi:Domain of unknown function (DUF4337)